ncbi:MAG: universal stress protein [Gemmatimonadetes bacterium]|nr:universal stress protein [Gemmatimonadota bacterium]
MPRDILIPLDGSATADAAIRHAEALARAYGGGLHLVRVYTPITAFVPSESPVAIPDPNWDKAARENAQEWIVKAAASVRARVAVPVTYELRIGDPVDEIVAAARAHDVAMIACTTHGHGGWAPQWLGSVTDGIVRRAHCPVYAMSESAVKRTPGIKRILMPLDGSRTAAAVIPFVRDLAIRTKATVDIYRVVAPPWVGDALNAVQGGHVDPFNIDPVADQAKHEIERIAQDFVYACVHATSTVEVATVPIRAILERVTATDPDIVALSTHGRGLSRLFMGSVADKVLRAGGRPTFCWRPPAALTREDDALESSYDMVAVP